MEETKEEKKSSEDQNQAVEQNPSEEKKAKPVNKSFIGLLIVAIASLVLYSDYSNGKFGKTEENSENKIFTIEEAQKFINENLLNGATCEVSEVNEENLYKINFTVGSEKYESYLTKDEKFFFVEGINVDEAIAQKKEAEAAAVEQEEQQKINLTKSEKPKVELFVMSHCPYGTQIEKGILPVVKALGDKIDFELKFCDYAMHGEKELNEQLNQYCISQNEPDKLVSYLECFLTDGDGEGCLDKTGINTSKLNTCVKNTDNKYKVTAGFKDESTWKSGVYPSFTIFAEDVEKYTITGSPSLIINGDKISSKRDPQSLLGMVCAGFENAPEECNQTLSSTVPSAEFGWGEGSNTSASCG